MKKKRKVCVVINSRANYGRVKSLLKAIKKSKNLELQLIVGASATLYRYGSVDQIIKRDGFKITQQFCSILEGENLLTMTKSLGHTVNELSTIFNSIKPDVVFVIADRYENLAVAIVSSYMNIFLAHIQGGEVSGSIDEKVRHAITKLSDLHFPATKRAKQFLIKMGEFSNSVYLTGCPSIDLVYSLKNKKMDNQILNKKGSGCEISLNDEFIIVLQHPVTTEYSLAKKHISETIKAIKDLTKKSKIKILWLWPNIDAGSDVFSKQIRLLKEEKNNSIRFVRNFNPEDYLIVLKKCKMIIGNSSSGIRECSFLGIPSINIGSRQQNRERGPNVIDVDYNSSNIIRAIFKQLHKKYKSSKIYGDGGAGQRISNVIGKVDLKLKYKLNYLKN